MVWTSLYLYDDFNNNIKWRIEGILYDDIINGLITAGLMLLQEIDNASDLYFIASNDDRSLDIRDPDDFDKNLIQEYHHVKKNIHHVSPKKKYGVWVARYGDSDYYDLLTFDHADLFMQGFITMCNAFLVNFRDYILGPLFDSSGITYDILLRY